MKRAVKDSRRARGSARRRASFSLVEIMVACLVLLVLALAGGAAMFYALAQVGVQQARREALAAANTRLEEVRAAPYDRLTPPAQNPPLPQYYYLRHTPGAGGSWSYGTTNWSRPLPTADPKETVTIRGVKRPIVTTVTYVDVDGGLTSYDALGIVVTVGYGPGTQDTVRLETLRSP